MEDATRISGRQIAMHDLARTEKVHPRCDVVAVRKQHRGLELIRIALLDVLEEGSVLAVLEHEKRGHVTRDRDLWQKRTKHVRVNDRNTHKHARKNYIATARDSQAKKKERCLASSPLTSHRLQQNACKVANVTNGNKVSAQVVLT